MLGVPLPHSPFWVWLPALLGLFAGIVLIHSSFNLQRFGTFPYFNGIVRLIFVIAALSMDFGSTAGQFMGMLAWGDLPLALGCIFGLPYVLKKSHWQMLTNDLEIGRAHV